MPEGWPWGFYLNTRERLFFLCSQTQEDRNMWMSGFRYLLASTVTVQSIMRENTVILEKKIKERTDKIVEETKKEGELKKQKSLKR
jgi:hypothetical protein